MKEQPPAPLLSYIFMDRIKNNLFSKGLLRKIWTRYVNNIFHKDKVEKMFQVLNKVHLNFRFTIEIGDDGGPPFLDLRIIRRGQGITFDIYKNPTHTHRTLPEKLNHSYSMIQRMFTVLVSAEKF